MKKLNENHDLFSSLQKEPPIWWENLKRDQDIYIDIRKDNYVNAYYNGGAIMKLEYSRGYKGHIHFEYIPLQSAKDYVQYTFDNQDISLEKIETVAVNNFEKDSLEKIKKRISHFYPKDSEKGLQGNYVVHSLNKNNRKGFFLDSEFQFKFNSKNLRIDLVWIDIEKKRIAFVELKTIGDSRLFNSRAKKDTIEKQLSLYHQFIKEKSLELKEYYDKVIMIKTKLGLLPKTISESSLTCYEVIPKPILLIGDCTQEWINKNCKDINDKIRNVAYACFYQGSSSFDFYVPDTKQGNFYVF